MRYNLDHDVIEETYNQDPTLGLGGSLMKNSTLFRYIHYIVISSFSNFKRP
jgi:hypothetical protein